MSIDPEDIQERKRADLAKALAATDWFVMNQIIVHEAHRIRLRYNVLINNGFTEPQALQLCTQEWK